MRKHDPLPERMKADYFRIKADLGRRPLRLDMRVGSDIVSRSILDRFILLHIKVTCGFWLILES